ncbi:MAG: hypothetical protein WC054_11515, partial [Candidatus Nanopelagicales bacterium]
MVSRRVSTIAAASICSAALLVPAAAGTASAHPGDDRGRHGSLSSQNAALKHYSAIKFHGASKYYGASLSDAQKQAVKEAKATYRAAAKAARTTYKADTADERATLRAALDAATTKPERRAAFKEYRVTTKDEWATFKSTV